MAVSLEQRINAARERGRRWQSGGGQNHELNEAGWHLPGTCPRWRVPEFATMFIDDLLEDEVYKALLAACYDTARTVYNAGRKAKFNKKKPDPER